MTTLSSLLGHTGSEGFVRPVRGDGSYLMDASGKRYLDAAAGAMAVNLGYTNQRVASAIADTAARLPFAHHQRAVVPEREQLAHKLIALVPGDEWQVHLTTGGSNAIESAIQIALLYQLGKNRPHRTRMAATTHSYHGGTEGAVSLTSYRATAPTRSRPLMPTARVAAGFCRHCPLGLERPSCDTACARSFADLLESEEGADIAALFIEPIVGNAAGAVVPPDDYLPRLAAACRRHDVLLVADEVVTGLGRTGRALGCDHTGVVPDVLCFAKGLSAGYFPLGAVLLQGHVAQSFPPDSLILNHTHDGHPIGCAAGLAVFEEMERLELVARVAELGPYLHQRLGTLRSLPNVGDVRGRGLLAAVELVAGKDPERPFPRQRGVAAQVRAAAQDEGLLVFPGQGCVDGFLGDHITIAPPFIITREEIDLIVERLGRAISRVVGS